MGRSPKNSQQKFYSKTSSEAKWITDQRTQDNTAKATNYLKHMHEIDRMICKNHTCSCYGTNHGNGKPRTQKRLDGEE
jgi:hypothetical protein